MNIKDICKRLEYLPKEINSLSKRKEFLFHLKDEFLKKEQKYKEFNYSNEAGIKALFNKINLLNEEIKQLCYKEEFLKEELKFYQKRLGKIKDFLSDNDYEKEIYKEKYIQNYSMTKISIRHNNIQDTTIRNILKKVEEELEKFLSDDLFNDWLAKKMIL